ncbi:hypothetical protein HRbin17_02350 [bacterium HR17]|uniref:Uncharacterized protein n=1 Tax=Candidatus Fervidibacter japonicus TaxID=2035412 RepID=A0A2H5XF51_9BACT|nr:hypothetical protein HRbin17_02350 [bacterium HR17]
MDLTAEELFAPNATQHAYRRAALLSRQKKEKGERPSRNCRKGNSTKHKNLLTKVFRQKLKRITLIVSDIRTAWVYALN